MILSITIAVERCYICNIGFSWQTHFHGNSHRSSHRVGPKGGLIWVRHDGVRSQCRWWVGGRVRNLDGEGCGWVVLMRSG